MCADYGYVKSGVAPGIFRRGADSTDKGAKIRFSGTINARNLQKNACLRSDGD